MSTESVPVASSLLGRLAAVGIDVPRLLGDAGLPRARFAAAHAKLTVEEFLRFWDLVDAADTAGDIGLRLATESRVHQLNVASLAALCSPDFATALHKLTRYKQLCCAPQLVLSSAGDEAQLEVRWSKPLPPVYIDGMLASALHLLREGTGTLAAPKVLELARRRSPSRALERYFGCRVRYGAARDCLRFDAAVLALPFRTHNAALLSTLLPGLEAQLAARPGAFLDEVRLAIERRLSGEPPTVAKIARDLALSTRTLQRRLTGLGTSYQAQLDEARRATATRLLAATELQPSEVAFLLGFQELNSFSRAFAAWEGTTPLRWRASSQQARR